ncbi:DUF5694 domain-containing protein [uncultured Hyphomonas sp.]|uniref:DUF5694 domain-containing protein n=1 Tax=uncultured Hyphomonas sp. TaxID=225298 RepID=UPI002AABF84D|nr:DUF5694 domain-containing protein [uncultured Hyphomonas sp.]
MTLRLISALAALFLAACTTVAPDPAPETDVVKVMVLGTYHFANPGYDVVNMQADDVLRPQRQQELEALMDRLAAFRPTVVAIESTRRTDGLLSDSYKAFQPSDLSKDRNEIVQIGFRLADQQGLDRVYAIDEHDGDLDFFPFDRVQAAAEATGQTGLIEEKIARIQAESQAVEAAQSTETITQLLGRHNDTSKLREQHDEFYYGMLGISDGEDLAGAALNYGWYARNALIFANLVKATRPGDRVVVVYGAGHAYWLRHFVEETPGFELEETMDYLR